jgi:hypothetical protein
VLLPDGLALNIGIHTHGIGPSDNYLKEAYISSYGARPELITPGYHALDGSYTDLNIKWHGIEFRVESATSLDGDIYILITPLKLTESTPSVILETGFLWNRKGTLKLTDEGISANNGTITVEIHSSGTPAEEFMPVTSPYLSLALDKQVAFYTGKPMTLEEIKKIISSRRMELETNNNKYGKLAQSYQAMQSVLGWNIIYDASRNRVICPVSRIWNDKFGGQSVLFDWDTYFSAYMSSMENKDLAYANAVEITKSITPGGFIPNWAGSYRDGSFDRSQPPVGSLVFRELFRKYHEKWILKFVFDDLMTWNRWWTKNRDNNGYLCWGSSPFNTQLKSDSVTNSWQGAAFESGLDNSPMYDNIPFNTQTHMLELADAGLMGLYITDCDALADIAMILGKQREEMELRNRAVFYRKNLAKLWNEKTGMYLNKRTDNNLFSSKLSPTNFYPMLGKVPDNEQAKRMVKEHLLNHDEFFGEWMIPSISRNDSSFQQQDYWRGRIWGPMNFLVYLGLLNYNEPEARKIIAEKSTSLLMENFKRNGWIFENYNAITGNMRDFPETVRMGDNYYHWGALLVFISFIESGFVENPMNPINMSQQQKYQY